MLLSGKRFVSLSSPALWVRLFCFALLCFALLCATIRVERKERGIIEEEEEESNQSIICVRNFFSFHQYISFFLSFFFNSNSEGYLGTFDLRFQKLWMK